YYQILGILVTSGSLPTSEIGKMLYISKPNMTPLIDKLVDDNMVKRVRSDKDRRIVYIEITEEGESFLWDARKVVEENIRENLLNLNDNDLKILNESLENIKRLVMKISPE